MHILLQMQKPSLGRRAHVTCPRDAHEAGKERRWCWEGSVSLRELSVIDVGSMTNVSDERMKQMGEQSNAIVV